jgi:hypothetical protein
MPRRSGRPRTNLERKILAEMSEDEERFQKVVSKRLGSLAGSPWRIAFEAGCLRLTLEKGTLFQKAICAPLIKKLRGTKWARTNDPRERLSDREFLERLIEAHVPGFDWREDARQGESEDRIREQQDERIAQESAEHARWNMAWATKYYTPDAPDCVLLHGLAWENRKQRRFIRNPWPTLRELKLATAIPERTLKKIMESLGPKNGEIIKEPFRHKFSRGGALPLRYGPRLVVGVLNEFVNRLSEFAIDDEERERLRKTALLVKRAFVARLERSGRST